MEINQITLILELAEKQTERFNLLLSKFRVLKKRLLMRLLLLSAIDCFIFAYFIKAGLSFFIVMVALILTVGIGNIMLKKRYENTKILLKKAINFEKEQLSKILSELSEIEIENKALMLNIDLKLSRANNLISQYENLKLTVFC